MKSVSELLSDWEWLMWNYVSFDILFLDIRNESDNNIPIAMKYQYINFLELIDFIYKNKNKETNITDFSIEYLDDGIRFHIRTGDFKFHYSDAKFPDTSIFGFELTDYIINITTALTRIFNIPYKPIVGVRGYTLGVIPYLSVNAAANFMAIDLDTSTLKFPIIITSPEDRISVLKQLGLPDRLIQKSYINILGKNTFINADDLVSSIYMINE